MYIFKQKKRKDNVICSYRRINFHEATKENREALEIDRSPRSTLVRILSRARDVMKKIEGARRRRRRRRRGRGRGGKGVKGVVSQPTKFSVFLSFYLCALQHAEQCTCYRTDKCGENAQVTTRLDYECTRGSLLLFDGGPRGKEKEKELFPPSSTFNIHSPSTQRNHLVLVANLTLISSFKSPVLLQTLCVINRRRTYTSPLSLMTVKS